jgi:hypothetical protein
VTWREGTNARLSSRFARARVRAAHGEVLRAAEWLLIEWPRGEAQPTKYFLCTLPENIAVSGRLSAGKDVRLYSGPDVLQNMRVAFAEAFDKTMAQQRATNAVCRQAMACLTPTFGGAPTDGCRQVGLLPALRTLSPQVVSLQVGSWAFQRMLVFRQQAGSES